MANLAANPGTGEPVLCVLRPTSPTQFTLDAYMSIDENLLQVTVVDVGPIAAKDRQ